MGGHGGAWWGVMSHEGTMMAQECHKMMSHEMEVMSREYGRSHNGTLQVAGVR